MKEAIESASYNLPRAIGTGAGEWAQGHSTTAKSAKLTGFLLYMPLTSKGIGGTVGISTPAKVKFGNKKIPIKVVFGGPSGASGTLIGLGMEMKGHSHLIRMDYYRCNSGHGGATGLQTRELSV